MSLSQASTQLPLRRRAVLLAAAVASGLGIAGVAGWLIGETDTPVPADPLAELSDVETSLANQIRANFSYLDIEADALARFAQAFAKYGLGRREPVLRAADFHRFLLSTDFFQNGANESRRLRYARYYDPYVSPCYNPLREPHTPAAEVDGVSGTRVRSKA